MPDYTLVLGIDAEHLKQLKMVWPSWVRHKPELMNVPLVLFYDAGSLVTHDLPDFIRGDRSEFQIVSWVDKHKTERSRDKWSDPHRRHMLSGFVIVPPLFVKTKYWLKIDTDVVATGQPDWIDEKWFEGDPAIVAHRWSFTKPPNQMEVLDKWAARIGVNWPTPPLNLHPLPGGTRLGHKRIISWCGFFNTEFSRECARLCGEDRMPVGSQDGFHWYCAKRMNKGIKRVDMKRLGWEHWGTVRNIQEAVKRAMA